MGIGGALSLDALRLLHRPRSAAEMRVAISEMAARGMGAYEIAAASGVTVEEVRRLLSLQRSSGEVLR